MRLLAFQAKAYFRRHLLGRSISERVTYIDQKFHVKSHVSTRRRIWHLNYSSLFYFPAFFKKTMMISISRLRRTIALSMLLFNISGTTGYPSGIEIVNASFCGECLSFDLFLILFKRYSALKSCSGIITEYY